MLVGAVDRSDVTTADGKYNDQLHIGETSYVLPRLFREQAKEVLAGPSVGNDAPPAEADERAGPDDPSSAG